MPPNPLPVVAHWGGVAPMLTLLALFAPFAHAADSASSAERPDLPFKSLAGEDGVHVLFQNPALMNFDRDAGYGFYYQRSAIDQGLNSFTIATTGQKML